MEAIPFIFRSWQKNEIKVYSEKTHKNIDYIDIVDLNTKNAYRDEPKSVIRGKCFNLLCYMSVCTIFRMSWNLFLQVPFDFSKIVVHLSKDLFSITHVKTCDVAKNGLVGFSKELSDLSEDIINVVRPLFFILPLEFAAFLGLYSPYDGRALFAKFEKFFIGVPHQKDFRRIVHDEKLSYFRIFFRALNKRNNVVYYSAFCFQPLCNLKDKKVVSFKPVDEKN
ncbi:MAG: hypothetical protein HZB76_04670 [Chlamydiae bacterium]|nr:hypothetical protein [Chlamydiota bacterium]